ncbi:MAG: c-type cytochrome [Sphingomonadaceae bacterium]|nr:c-type cytochrome [Sphingomonadaceae bacterium]
MRKLAPFAALILLAGCGQGAEEPAADTPETAAPVEAPMEDAAVEAPADDAAAPVEAAATAAVAAAPAAFAQCKVCHAVEAGKNGVGPSLAAVFGAKAGHVETYTYSPAMKNSGLTWDEATLNSYLEGPMAKVPGTKMAFAGIKDAAKRQEVIDYLKTL